jgi:cephalosporin hydroxylase
MAEYELYHERYDYIMRARIDFICPEKIVFAHYYLNHDKQHLYNFGSYQIDEFEWTDEYAFFAKRETADKLFLNLDRLGFIKHDRTIYNTIHNNNEFLFCPETQYSLLLHELNLSVIRVMIYRTGKYTNGGDGYDYMNYMFKVNRCEVEHEYKLCLNSPTDINEHLPILREYASKCNHITELGTRFGNSTLAFMVVRPKKFVTYDVAYNEKIDYLKKIAIDNDINFHFREENPQEIEETDLLLIDTDHHVDQCSKELKLHADKVRKYLIFHDVVSFWEKGQGYESGGGLRYAIEPFMAEHPEWKQVYRAENNNGLLILERC